MSGRFFTQAFLGSVVAGLFLTPALSAQEDYLPGDVNADGEVNIADAAFLRNYLGLGGPRPTCFATADVNGDEQLTWNDMNSIPSYLVGVGEAPPDPSPGDDCSSYTPEPAPKLADVSVGLECGAATVAPNQFAEVFLTVTTENNTTNWGPEGWSANLGLENLRMVAASYDGITIETHRWAEETPGGDVWVAAFVSPFGGPPFQLEAEGTERVLRLIVEADPAAVAAGATTGRIFFKDAEPGSGPPFANIVSLLGTAQIPTTSAGCSFQLSNDCNGNGVPDDTEPDLDGDGIPNDCEDCNENLVRDGVEIAEGISFDCNANGIPDECETDCNSNGVLDSCDIAEGTSFDCDLNGVPDECETDCNQNGMSDSCDIAEGTSADCNANGIPDECEPDCNLNGIPDDCDLTAGISEDQNGDGVPDECEGLRFRFVGPEVIEGEPGSTVTVDYLCRLEYYGRDDPLTSWVFAAIANNARIVHCARNEGPETCLIPDNGTRGLASGGGHDGAYGGCVVDARLQEDCSPDDLVNVSGPMARISVEVLIPEDSAAEQVVTLQYVNDILQNPTSSTGARVSNVAYPWWAVFTLVPLEVTVRAASPGSFLRGDCNDDGTLDISDPVFNLEVQFLGEHDPGCLAALDTNADGAMDISDPIYNLEHQFLGRSAPPPPYPGCGPESLPLEEALPCDTRPASCP